PRDRRLTAASAVPSPPPQPRPGFVAVGYVRAPFGVRGELAVELLTDSPQPFEPGAALWAGGREYRVYAARSHRGGLLVELHGLQSRTQADGAGRLLLGGPHAGLSPL